MEEVRSIRYNQEQENVIMHKRTSKSMTFPSESSADIREMANKQDLITALVDREKVYDSTTNIGIKHKSSH